MGGENIHSSLQWRRCRKVGRASSWSQILPGWVPTSSFWQVPLDLDGYRGSMEGKATCYRGTDPRDEKAPNSQASQEAQLLFLPPGVVLEQSRGGAGRGGGR